MIRRVELLILAVGLVAAAPAGLTGFARVVDFAPGGTVYSGTKFAVSAISEGLRHEVGERSGSRQSSLELSKAI